jgi:hypothetical protein
MSARSRRTAVMAATMTLMGVCAVQAVTGSPASAAPPGGCQKYQTQNSGTVTCLSIDESRVVIVCTHAGTPYTLYGPWIYGAGLSYAVCNAGDLLGGAVPPEANVRYDY